MNWCFWTVVLGKTLESPLDCKEIQPVHPKGDQSWEDWKDWCWSCNSNTLTTWCEELTHWKRPWCQEGLGAEGEGDNRGWDGWMASPTQWTWVWVDSGRSGVLQSMGSQRVRHDWATELNWKEAWASQVALIKNPPTNAGDVRDVGFIPGSGRSPGEGNPLQYFCLRNPMERSLAGYSPWGCKRVGNEWSDLACIQRKLIRPSSIFINGNKAQDNHYKKVKLLPKYRPLLYIIPGKV